MRQIGTGAMATAMILAATVLAPTPAAARVDQHIDAESATIRGAVLRDNGRDHALLKARDGLYPVISDPATAPAYRGRHSIKAHVRESTPGPSSRSEVRIKEGVPMSAHRVVGFSVFVPSSFDAGPTDGSWLILSQLWQFPGGSPPIALQVKPKSNPPRYQLSVRNDAAGAPGKPTTGIIRHDGPLPRGGWTRIVLDFSANPTGSGGYVSVHVNGSLKYTYRGAVGYSRAVSSRQALDFRTGIYRTASVTWPAQTFYFDEMKYGNVLGEVR